MIEKGIEPDILLDMDSGEFHDMLKYLHHKNTKTAELTDEQRDMMQNDKDDEWWKEVK